MTIGTKRQFTFSNKPYIIQEELEVPEISMAWTWDSGLCPHCKNRISRTISHKFIKIEILLEEGATDTDINKFIFLGFTEDNKTLILSKDKYKEVLQISKKYNNLKDNI